MKNANIHLRLEVFLEEADFPCLRRKLIDVSVTPFDSKTRLVIKRLCSYLNNRFSLYFMIIK